MYRAVKPVTMGVRMSQNMHDVLAKMARADNESMGSVVRAAIREYMVAKGYTLRVGGPDSLHEQRGKGGNAR